jgi:hypothetical protein
MPTNPKGETAQLKGNSRLDQRLHMDALKVRSAARTRPAVCDNAQRRGTHQRFHHEHVGLEGKVICDEPGNVVSARGLNAHTCAHFRERARGYGGHRSPINSKPERHGARKFLLQQGQAHECTKKLRKNNNRTNRL